MSAFTSSVVPDFFLTLQRVKSAVQRIPFRMVPPRFTDWYVNAADNFAVRAHVICSDDGSACALLTLRKGGAKANIHTQAFMLFCLANIPSAEKLTDSPVTC
ncbi:hypothetical protein [Serratia ureilytica]|uniref:hypothetical protein n=1 Tax=Serratia ureilytica TaxID=300181 RepID=UPI0021C2FFE7|nr:hypothetical protein [Serratia ureilytica]